MGVLDRVRNSPTFQRIMRVLQFLSAIISLGLFSARLYRVLRLAQKANRAQGAVEGILAAASAYTLALMLYKLFMRHGGPNWLRWLVVLLDVLFVGAFIAVADLTRPRGPAGPCQNKVDGVLPIPRGLNCNLPYGTFVLAILSTILHALTAVFHQVKDHHAEKKRRDEEGEIQTHEK